MNWEATLIENQDPCLTNYEAFIEKMKPVSRNINATFSAIHKLRTIKQRRLLDIQQYILQFNKYSIKISWNEEGKMDTFSMIQVNLKFFHMFVYS